MTTCVIELNDSEIRVAKGSEIILRSPGYAVIGKDKIEIGAAALKQARLNPRAAHNRYWKNLNQDPLQYPSSRARHNADLAYAQLLAIHEQAGKPKEAIFAVPGSCSNEQLALLLGLVEASPLKAVGLVDTAVAATALIVGRGDYVHVDIHSHQVILTRINVREKVSRSSVNIIDGVGLATVYDTVAHLIADLFIRESRFDPQHYPETEQALYDQIPACLHALQTYDEIAVEIQYQQTQYQARLTTELLLHALQAQYQKIITAVEMTDTALISDRLADLPGLASRLNNAEVLSPTDVFVACQTHEAIIRSSGSSLNHVTSLPATSTPVIIASHNNDEQVTEIAPVNKQTITHVLHGYHAFPLDSGRLYLSASGEISSNDNESSHCSARLDNGRVWLKPNSEFTVFLNGRQVQDITEVHVGDIISFIGSKTEYIFIHVNG